MGRHDPPRTGDGRTRSGPPIGRAEVNYVNKRGTSLLGQLGRLWTGTSKKAITDGKVTRKK